MQVELSRGLPQGQAENLIFVAPCHYEYLTKIGVRIRVVLGLRDPKTLISCQAYRCAPCSVSSRSGYVTNLGREMEEPGNEVDTSRACRVLVAQQLRAFS